MSAAARALALGLLVSLGACAPVRGSRVATVTIVPASAPPPAPTTAAGPEALIWITGDDGKPVTRWLAPTTAGYREVAEAPALYLTAGDDVWRWTTEEEKLPTIPCTEINGMPAGEGLGTRAVVERVPGPAERVVVTAPPLEGSNNDVQHTVTPIRSIGPYLLVREATYVYACGAHGFTGVSVHVWDLAARKSGDLLGPSEKGTVETSVRDEARRMLHEGSGEEEEAKAEEISYAASLPRFGAHGWLHVDHAFTTFACYACSDGEWSSYTRGVNVPAPWLPERVRAYARPPAVVSAYLDEHRDVTLGGWSVLSPTAARSLERALAGK